MLLGAWLLGWFLHHIIFCSKHKTKIKELEAQLKSAGNRIGDLEGDLESCNAAVVKIKGENAGLSSQIGLLEREKADWLTRSTSKESGTDDSGTDANKSSSSGIIAPPAELDLVADVKAKQIEELDEDSMISSLASDIAGPAQAGFDSEKAGRVFGRTIAEDDLQIIEGVGPKTAELFLSKSIHTWRQLGNTSVTQLQHILNEAGPPYTNGDPSTWPKQARMAADGEWNKLREYQQYLVGGSEPSDSRHPFVDKEAPDDSEEHLSNPSVISDKDIADPDKELESGISSISSGPITQRESTAAQTDKTDAGDKMKAIYGRTYQQDDLRIIEGIGPKTADLLGSQGISTWRQLSETSAGQLQGLLDQAGSRFQLLNPSTWPKQAGMAAQANWKQLRAYQDHLVGGLEPDGGVSLSEEASDIKYAMGKRIEKDDLTVVEGIGPKTALLLKDAGILSWHQLGQTSGARLQEVLDRAGSRFQLLDPATWPKQAMLAARDDWDALEEYQQFLVGGKEPS